MAPKNKTCGCEGKCDCAPISTDSPGGNEGGLDGALKINHPGAPIVDAVTEE